MKTELLPALPAFKANLHAHTTLSDGGITPEDLRELYKAQGYSILAYTDHDVLIDQSALCQPDFLALNGYEIEVMEPEHPRPFGSVLTCHFCLIAKDQKNLRMIGYNKDKYLFANAVNLRPQLQFDRDDYERVYSGPGISEMMRLGRENGFFVTYNHPGWSMESYPQYAGYEGMDAMEIFNTASYEGGWAEYNDRVYDDLLRQGKRIYCVAADDVHGGGRDACGGWVMVFAEKLDYACVIDALEKGHFYASTGPEIRSLYVEDGKVHVACSPAHAVRFITGARHSASIGGGKDWSTHIEEAVFTPHPDDGYFRVDVVDDHGCHAYSNAYWLDELGM